MLGFCLGQFAAVFDFYAFYRTACQINSDGAQMFCQCKIWLNDGSDIFRNGRHIYSGHDRFAFQCFDYAVSNVHSHTYLRFDGGCAEMSSLHDIKHI